MEEIMTIKSKPIIAIYESFDGSYWFITEKLYKQDTVLNGRIYKNDQIFFGYARLSACPEFAEFGNISETELKLAGAWKVPKKNWPVCPEVEVVDKKSVAGEEIKASPLFEFSNKCYKECFYKMAWRPNEQFIEGVMDNTVPGKVTGWMRFADIPIAQETAVEK